MLICYFTKIMVSSDVDSTNAVQCQNIHGDLFSSQSSLESTFRRPCLSAASHFQRCLYFLCLYLWTLPTVLQCQFKSVFWKLISLLLLVSFILFFGILNFIILRPFSQNILLSSSEPSSLFGLCIWHYLDSTLFPPSPARIYWPRCWRIRTGCRGPLLPHKHAAVTALELS